MTARRVRPAPVDIARAIVAERVDRLGAARDLVDALGAASDLVAAAVKARETLAVAAVLGEGWSYAQLGRALRITRQAAVKTYGPIVDQQLHRNARRAAAGGDVTVTEITDQEVPQT